MKESNYIFVEDNTENRDFPFIDSLSFSNFFYGKIINYKTPISEIRTSFLLLIQKKFGDYMTPNRKIKKAKYFKGTFLNSASDQNIIEETPSNHIEDCLSWEYAEFTAALLEESKKKVNYVFGIDKTNFYYVNKSEIIPLSKGNYNLNVRNSQSIKKIIISQIKKVEKSSITSRVYVYYNCKSEIEFRLIIEFETEEEMNNFLSKITFIRSE